MTEEFAPPEIPPTKSTVSSRVPLNKSSAPIPIDASARPPTPPPSDGLWISKEDQGKLERQLAHDKDCKTVPVWLSDDEEAGDGALCLNDQARWRRFAEHELYTLFPLQAARADRRTSRTKIMG